MSETTATGKRVTIVPADPQYTQKDIRKQRLRVAIVTTDAQHHQRQMYGCCSCTECHHMLILSTKAFQVFLESIDVGTQRHDPVGVKSFLDVFHFLTAHVSERLSDFTFTFHFPALDASMKLEI